MQEKQALIVSEHEEQEKGFREGLLCRAQADGMTPPGPLGSAVFPAVDIVISGTVEFFMPARSGGNVWPAAEGAQGRAFVSVAGSLRSCGGGVAGQEAPGRALNSERIWKKSEESRRKLARVREYIFTHYSERITLETLAAFVSLTPNALGHLFRAHEGVSVPTFLEDTRLERAAALLRGTGRSITEISSAVGFTSAAYFCRRFRKAYGMTPGHYRLKEIRCASANEPPKGGDSAAL